MCELEYDKARVISGSFSLEKSTWAGVKKKQFISITITDKLPFLNYKLD